jgi:SAM-dependent methyltransferase
MKQAAKSVVQGVIRRLSPASGRVEELLRPTSTVFGRERGFPIDRYYIENFIAKHADDIRGDVLEVSENTYSKRHGKDISHSDVLHVIEGTPNATIVGDLTVPASLPENRFDCFICTQTLSFLEDPAVALRTCAQMLKGGGVLILTVPGISQISEYDMNRWGDYWRFTSRSVDALARRAFPGGDYYVEVFGNVFAAKAALDGLAVEDLPDARLLDHSDPSYQVLIGLWARKAIVGSSHHVE